MDDGVITIKDKPAAGPVIRLHDSDNVLIARADIAIGAKLEGGLTAKSQVPAGHKIAARAIKKGEPILKYAVTIGFASADIPAGTYVHSHNLEFREFDRDYAYARDYKPVDMIPEAQRASFMGIVRANGQVATRNYLGVLSTVNCSATVAHRIAEYFTPERLAEYPNIDGVCAFAHGTGCGMEMTGEPMDLLRRTMAGYAKHANLAGALIVGLGCERNQLKGLMKEENLEVSDRLKTFIMQESGGTRKTIEAGIAALRGVPGRMEAIELGQDFTAVVDFAHTPNALKAALEAGRQLTDGKVITVFGSAGLRDKAKRRMMAELAAELADRSVLTAEDPRTESLDNILEEMAAGAKSKGGKEGETFWRVPDRGTAISFALLQAKPGDLVLVLGKGHEQSMCFGETEYPWDDRVALRAALAELLGVEGPTMPKLPTSG